MNTIEIALALDKRKMKSIDMYREGVSSHLFTSVFCCTSVTHPVLSLHPWTRSKPDLLVGFGQLIMAPFCQNINTRRKNMATKGNIVPTYIP